MIQFYPNFQTQLRDALGRLVGKKVEGAVEIGLAKDGSGVGGKLLSKSSSLQRVILKLFISRFGCPDRRASSFDITVDHKKSSRLLAIVYEYKSKFMFICTA